SAALPGPAARRGDRPPGIAFHPARSTHRRCDAMTLPTWIPAHLIPPGTSPLVQLIATAGATAFVLAALFLLVRAVLDRRRDNRLRRAAAATEAQAPGPVARRLVPAGPDTAGRAEPGAIADDSCPARNQAAGQRVSPEFGSGPPRVAGGSGFARGRGAATTARL